MHLRIPGLFGSAFPNDPENGFSVQRRLGVRDSMAARIVATIARWNDESAFHGPLRALSQTQRSTLPQTAAGVQSVRSRSRQGLPCAGIGRRVLRAVANRANRLSQLLRRLTTCAAPRSPASDEGGGRRVACRTGGESLGSAQDRPMRRGTQSRTEPRRFERCRLRQ